MISLSFDPLELTSDARAWWVAWEAEAADASRVASAAVQDGQEPVFNSDVWKKLKLWLFANIFNQKCAYCEGDVATVAFGDGEHWRPKGGVTESRAGKVVKVQTTSGDHPGYWWLAHDWRNLLPACQRCNSGTGKNNLFPVAAQHLDDASLDPDALDVEELPLLLHPFRGPPAEAHLRFTEFGQVVARNGSRWGSSSIETLDLNREPLRNARQARWEEAQDGLAYQFLRVGEGSDFEAVFAKWIGPQARYSASVRQLVLREREQFIRNLSGIAGS